MCELDRVVTARDHRRCTPPPPYLRELRVDRAAGLLRDTDTPLAQIACEVGYSTDHALSTAFAGARGHPPGAYRRQLRVMVSFPVT
ncbi:MAG: hypothetical protein V7607_4435 [Solirubrobacteraceae bacterium]